jgi:hypothetical protein
MDDAVVDVLRLWSYEDRDRKISCLYGTTINNANIKYVCVYEQEINTRYNITICARVIKSNISCTSDINIDIEGNIIYCDIRKPIFRCLPVFLRDCILEITLYKLYCKMVALYRVDWHFTFLTRIVKRIREYKNYKLFKIVVKREVRIA